MNEFLIDKLIFLKYQTVNVIVLVQYKYFFKTSKKALKMKILMKIAICCLIILSIFLFANELYWYIKNVDTSNHNGINDESKFDMANMSRLLTNAMKKLGQLSCNVSVDLVSQNGGWCANISGPDSIIHYFDAGFARELGQILSGKSSRFLISYNQYKTLKF